MGKDTNKANRNNISVEIQFLKGSTQLQWAKQVKNKLTELNLVLRVRLLCTTILELFRLLRFGHSQDLYA